MSQSVCLCTDSVNPDAGLVMRTEGMSTELLQAAGHVVTQIAPQLDGVALSNESGPLLTPVSALLEVGSELVPGAVSVRLAV